MRQFQFARLFFGNANIVWTTGDDAEDKAVLAQMKALIPANQPGIPQAPPPIRLLNIVGPLGWEPFFVANNGVDVLLKREVPVALGETTGSQELPRQVPDEQSVRRGPGRPPRAQQSDAPAAA